MGWLRDRRRSATKATEFWGADGSTEAWPPKVLVTLRVTDLHHAERDEYSDLRHAERGYAASLQ